MSNAGAQRGGPYEASPRGFSAGIGRSPEKSVAHDYRAYLTALQARLGPLPASARPWLREAGLCELEIQRVAGEHQRAVARRRLTEARRLRRTQTGLGRQLMRLEAKLEQLAATSPRSPADVAAAIMATRDATQQETSH